MILYGCFFFKENISTEETSLLSVKDILQRSLITAPTTEETIYINREILYEWMKLVNLKKCATRKRHIDSVSQQNKRTYYQNTKNLNVLSDEESYAEKWVREYLKSIDSPGRIHSINTGRNGRLILCNIRNMNTCKNVHEDYYNDSTIYMNIKEKQFSIRCNRMPCRNNRWIWNSMF